MLAARDLTNSGRSFARLEARLWGFARHETPALLGVLRGIAASLSPDAWTEPPSRPHENGVGTFDADTLLWRGSWTVSRLDFENEAAQLVEALLREPAFDRLCLMLRLSACETHADHPDSDGRRVRGNTLVLWGRIRQQKFDLKAAWPAFGVAPTEESMHWAPWPHEEEFLREVDRVRDGAEPRLSNGGKECFPTQNVEKFSMGVTNLICMPVKWTLAAFCQRVGVMGGAIAVSLLLLWRVPQLWVAAVTLLAVSGFGLVFLVRNVLAQS
jgi:hypothetical protein